MAEEIVRRKLTAESIAKTCDEVQDFFDKSKAEKRDGIRIKFLLEEALLSYQDQFGTNVEYEVHQSNKPLKASIQLIVYCSKYNPFKREDEGVMSSLIAASTQQNPAWQYVKSSFEWLVTSVGRNEIIFSVPKQAKASNPVKILFGLLGGIALGFAVRLLLGAELSVQLSDFYILPLANTYTGLLSVMAILMLFFSLPLCIVQYKNASEFQNSTKNLITAFIGFASLSAVVVTLVCLAIYGANGSGSSATAVFRSLFNVVIGFFPNSLIAPFINFDCMQIMIIGVMFGFAFLAMGEQSKPLVEIFDKTNYVAVIVNQFFTKYVAVYVFIMSFHLVLSSKITQMRSMLGVIKIVVVAALLLPAWFIGRICLKFKISPRRYFEKIMPYFVILLTSANMGAAFMPTFQSMNRECGIEENYTGIGLNLGIILYKPLYIVFLSASSLAVAHLSGMLSIQMAIQIMFLSLVLSASIPNVNGGATSVIVVMMNQLGFVGQYAELVVSINALLQYIIVPINVVCTHCLVILRADKDGKLNVDALRA